MTDNSSEKKAKRLASKLVECIDMRISDDFTRDTLKEALARIVELEKKFAQPSPTAVVLDDERCLICAETEPHTGTCGSKDPRALCNRALSPQPFAQPVEQTWVLTDAQKAAVSYAINSIKAVPGWNDSLVATLNDLLTAARPVSGETE